MRSMKNYSILFYQKKKVDILILKIPSKILYQLPRLDKAKIPYVVADNQLYYQVNINKYEPLKLKCNSLIFVEAKIEDKKIIGDLIREIFLNYKNHYTSNPLLKTDDIFEGYTEWACNYINSSEKGRYCWLLKIMNETVGFATAHYDETSKQGEIALIGVSRLTFLKYKTLGIYDDIIRYIQKIFKDKGCRKIITSTQSHNLSVQRIWVNEGFILLKAYNTIHINGLFNNPKERQAYYR